MITACPGCKKRCGPSWDNIFYCSNCNVWFVKGEENTMKKKTRKPPIRETKPRHIGKFDMPHAVINQDENGTFVFPSHAGECAVVRFLITRPRATHWFQVVFDSRTGKMKIYSGVGRLKISPRSDDLIELEIEKRGG